MYTAVVGCTESLKFIWCMSSSLHSFDIACFPPHCVAWLDTSVCGRLVKSC